MKSLIATLSGRGGKERLELLSRHATFRNPPGELTLEDEDVAVTDEWLRQLTSAQREGRARWEPSQGHLGFLPRSDELVVVRLPVDQVTLSAALELIEPLPFALCSFGASFFDEWNAADYKRWGFSRSHISFGWGCAFRGIGHDQLVSRRWLDFGPWRVIRRPNDTTLVQFHDLNLTDPAEAYEQAKLGHPRMREGFLYPNYADFMDDVRGLYLAEQQRLEIVVPPGETVDPNSLYGAAAVRLYFRAHPEEGHNAPEGTIGHVKTVAYVFVDEAQALAHLHILWLHEFECILVDGRGKRRLDDTYHPIPDPPAWVRASGPSGVESSESSEPPGDGGRVEPSTHEPLRTPVAGTHHIAQVRDAAAPTTSDAAKPPEPTAPARPYLRVRAIDTSEAELSQRLGAKVVFDDALSNGVEVHLRRVAQEVGFDLEVEVVRAGKQALISDVLAQRMTLERVARYNQIMGELRQLAVRFAAWFDPRPAAKFPPDSRGQRTQDDLTQLGSFQTQRHPRLGLGKVDPRMLRDEIEFLSDRCAYHEEVLRSLDDYGEDFDGDFTVDSV